MNAPSFSGSVRAGLALNNSCFMQWNLRQWEGIVFPRAFLSLNISTPLTLYPEQSKPYPSQQTAEMGTFKEFTLNNEHLKHTQAPRQGKILSHYQANLQIYGEYQYIAHHRDTSLSCVMSVFGFNSCLYVSATLYKPHVFKVKSLTQGHFGM